MPGRGNRGEAVEISDSSCLILAALLEARTGQQLGVDRRWRIGAALTEVMRDRKIDSVDRLAAMLVTDRDASLADAVVEGLLNNETYFFRDRASFDLLIDDALARLQRVRASRRMTIWCAGCATGQEAYSIAMSIAQDPVRWNGWTVDIVGTDVSRAAIVRASEGLYSQFEVQRGLSVRQMLQWFGKERDQWRISPRLREMVRFEVRNLHEGPPEPGMFDVVLCRNLLLYFAPDARRRALDRLSEAVASDGLLMLGAGETVIGHTHGFVPDPDLRGLYSPVPRRVPRRSTMAHRLGRERRA